MGLLHCNNGAPQKFHLPTYIDTLSYQNQSYIEPDSFPRSMNFTFTDTVKQILIVIGRPIFHCAVLNTTLCFSTISIMFQCIFQHFLPTLVVSTNLTYVQRSPVALLLRKFAASICTVSNAGFFYRVPHYFKSRGRRSFFSKSSPVN